MKGAGSSPTELAPAGFPGFLEAFPDAIVIVGEDGRIHLVNGQAERLFGYERNELVGKPVEILVPARCRTGVDLHGVRKDGSEFPAEISAGPVQTQQGFLVMAAVRDVTERRKLEDARLRLAAEAADTANRDLEAFTYSVAHDLRAPLRGIDGFSQALLEDYADRLDAEGKHYLDRVRESAQHMAQLIDSLLALSRLTRGEVQPEQVDLGALARASATRLSEAEPERNVELVIADGLTAFGDARMLAVALDHLIGNAWKFSRHRPEPRIELGCIREDGRRVFFVRDNGAGFDMAFQSKLFGVFQRLHAPREFEGTGIGLATVQRIIRRHGGRVWGEGQVAAGATFYFTLDERGHRP